MASQENPGEQSNFCRRSCSVAPPVGVQVEIQIAGERRKRSGARRGAPTRGGDAGGCGGGQFHPTGGGGERPRWAALGFELPLDLLSSE